MKQRIWMEQEVVEELLEDHVQTCGDTLSFTSLELPDRCCSHTDAE